MTTLLIATRNANKVAEIRTILGDGFRCLDLSAWPDAPEVLEDAGTFAGNATKKSTGLAKWLGQLRGGKSGPGRPGLNLSEIDHAFVLADDSGLEVDALRGAPGVHSARFAADTGATGNSPTELNNAKLLRLLDGIPPERRTARFRCVVALTPVLHASEHFASPVCSADEAELQTELFEGTCEGRIGLALRGKGGFGYDPLFFPTGYNETFGQLGEEVKNRLSHRGKALEKLKGHLLGR